MLTNISIKKDFEQELQSKASIASQVFNVVVINQLDNETALQSSLENLLKVEDEITNIDVVKPADNQFLVVASSNLEKIGSNIPGNDEFPYRSAYGIQTPVTIEVARSTDQSGRSWSVVAPIIDASGGVVVLTNVEVSPLVAERAISRTFNQSFVVLLITVFVVALLLANHFKFVGYAQLTKKLQEADRLKTDFLSVATHELKAPMSTIKGYVSNVLDGTFGEVNDQMKSSLNEALKQTDRLNNLVQDLLNVSRIEQGRISFELKAVNVAEIIKPIINTYQEKAKDKGLELVYESPAEPLFIRADAGRFQEIMTNLIDNAIKYSLAGKVDIRHEVDAKIVKTIVRDSGIGMGAEERANLFSRFYRIKNKDTKDIGGTGLGLWIIKQYIERMGGKILVDSMKGVGTEFTVELPRVHQA